MNIKTDIKAVVFDFGKVICFPPDDSVMDNIAAIAGIERNLFEPVLWKLRPGYDDGTLTAVEYYGNVCREFNVNLSDDKLRQIWEIDINSWKNINPETEKLMQEIKNSGCLLGILSNMPIDFLQFARKNFPVFNLPHVGIFSCEAGVIKPEKAIYEKLLSRLKCSAKEVVFFDDMPENIDAALNLGIEGRIWESCDKARIDLGKLGLQL